MKVMLSWLREFAPVEGSAEDLGDVMSDLGMAVEELTTFAYPGVIVARVLATRTHPDADRVQLVDVDTGDGEALQIVCGAFNMSAGDLVPLATTGTVMPNGMEIAARKMRGQMSNGMLCAANELELGVDGEGIMLLPQDLTVGDALDAQLGLAGDALFDLEINPNRPDAMSVAGVARDLAARLDVPFSIPTATVRSTGSAVTDAASVEIVAPDLCGRFALRVVRGVDVGVSPIQRQLRLTLCGMRPINSVVDASNYVMLELGVPNHAYDLALVPDGALRVRRAQAGETLTTLDDVERTMAEGDGLICDATDRPIGMAGVMGGADTEIGDGTTEVLLEAAWWDPPSISRTARRHSLRSEASARFERGADPMLLEAACDRFAELLGASVDDGVIVADGVLPWPRPVNIRTARVGKLLGTPLSRSRIAELLEPIGFATTENGPDLDVEIPTWRYDSATEIDVIEEIARHHGYEALGRTVPRSPDAGYLSSYQQDRHVVRDTLVGLGLDEAMPLPLLGPETHLQAGLDDHQPLVLLNALTSEESTLRTSLLPGLVRAVAYNQSHRNDDVGLFEIGKVFQRGDEGDELPDEREHVAVALAGRDAAEAKRTLDALLGALAFHGHRIENADDLSGLHPTRAARVTAGDDLVGVIGEVDPVVLERFDITGRVGWVELNLGLLLGLPHGHRPYREISLQPSSDIDLAFVVEESISADDVRATLARAGGTQVVDLRLFDVYRGDQVGEGRRSLAYALRLQAPDHTLDDDEIGAVRQRCIDAVVSTHGAELRG
ncbi:MAG: phenylalanine--tRNA ligase subunit beta [Actinomycetota bacterium]